MTTFECDSPAASDYDAGTPLSDGDSYVPPSGDSPRRRSERAAQRISALGEMTAGLAHDLRNIFTIIESGLNLAERYRDDRWKADAALSAAHEGVGRGIRLTSQLLGFARAGEPALHSQNINDLLERMRTFLTYGAGPGIRVTLDLAPGLPRCRIDASRFNSAILNLVVNARDAMPDGGEIHIESDVCQQVAGDSQAAPKRCVRVRVSDQGSGMSADIADHLFDPYFTTKGEAGTGLGLPQVAAFMRSSGGAMRVSSEPGVGTYFDLFFPPSDCHDPIQGNLWKQLDRWVNEGGRPAPPSQGNGRSRGNQFDGKGSNISCP